MYEYNLVWPLLAAKKLVVQNRRWQLTPPKIRFGFVCVLTGLLKKLRTDFDEILQ